jgi:small redox-active disulfide protein 2
MKDVKVLGPGCAKCKTTAELIAAVAKETGAEIALGKVEDMREIVGYGVMSTPAVVVDGKVVHVGSVPGRAQVQEWLA